MTQEYLIIGLIINAIFGIFVFYDATKNKIGKINRVPGLLNMSAMAWGSISLLQFGASVLYFLSRHNLIKKSQTSPVETKDKNKKLLLLTAAYVFQCILLVLIIGPALK